MIEYEERDRLLLGLGFVSYAEYLKSKLWKKIRASVLKDFDFTCALCGNPATEVHHTDYAEETLKGDCIHTLVALCSTCHDLGEFLTNGKKATLEEANKRLGLLREFASNRHKGTSKADRQRIGREFREKKLLGKQQRILMRQSAEELRADPVQSITAAASAGFSFVRPNKTQGLLQRERQENYRQQRKAMLNRLRKKKKEEEQQKRLSARRGKRFQRRYTPE